MAVAAGIVPAAVGTDTSFSIIGCAQENGVCGLKPPAGNLSSKGIIPIARTLDSAGVLATDFHTALSVYSAMRDEPLPLIEKTPFSEMKLAVNAANQHMVSQGQLGFLQQAITVLQNNSASISEVLQPPTPHQRTIMQYEFKEHLEDYLKTSEAGLKTLAEIVDCYDAHPDTMMKYGISLLKRALDETTGGLYSEMYLNAMKEREMTISNVQEQLLHYDAVVMTGPTNISHFCGLPSVTIVGKQKAPSGVRRGLILYGLNEMRLYRAAMAIEEMLP